MSSISFSIFSYIASKDMLDESIPETSALVAILTILNSFTFMNSAGQTMTDIRTGRSKAAFA
jgi:hypothetical protein